jgi:hypothetical protein
MEDQRLDLVWSQAAPGEMRAAQLAAQSKLNPLHRQKT